MMKGKLGVCCLLVVAVVAAWACGSSSSPKKNEETPSPTPDFVSAPQPTPPAQYFAPYEGSREPPKLYPEGTDYRKLPEFELPDPSDLPKPPKRLDGPEYQPPAEPECPEGWQVQERPTQRFRICYPDGWEILGAGYRSVGRDERYYQMAIFKMGEDGLESAHVSVYVRGPHSQPELYIKECENPYRATLVGLPAGLCADYPGEFPEAKIIHYYLPYGDFVAYINVVPRYRYDPERGGYVTEWSEEDERTGIQIAQTFDILAEEETGG